MSACTTLHAVACLLAALLPAGAHCAGLEVLVQDPQGRPLPGAVVFVESAAARAAVRPGAAAEVVQVNRQFVPAVSVVPLGTSVNFPNRDTVRHHVYSFSPAKRFEIKLYVGTPAQPVVFDSPGIATLGCNIHDTMTAWVVVVETPWHGQTGADGRLKLPAVPAGAHRLRAWHPSMPPGELPADLPLQVPLQGVAQVQTRLAGASAAGL
jgi:plastocyanin